MASDPTQQDRYITIWAKAVDTQMHFNEMSVKSRQLGLTFVAAALGVGVVLLSRGDDVSWSLNLGVHIRVHVAVLLTLGALIALRAVKVLDLNVYHRMLRGAVTFGEDFEQNYMKQIFDLNKGMTQTISYYSRHQNAKATAGPDGRYQYAEGSSITAEAKILTFYKNIQRYLLLTAFALLVFTNLAVKSPASDLATLSQTQTDVAPASVVVTTPPSPATAVSSKPPGTNGQ